MTAFVAAGCSPHEVRVSHEPAVEIPTTLLPLDEQPELPGVVAPDQWWTAFNDPGLDQALTRSFSENLNLAQAWARLEQARAQARIQGAYLYPEVNVDAAASRSRQTGGNGDAFYGNRFAIGVGLTWELDLWKKIANRTEAAQLLANASRDDAEQTALLLSGTVVDLWFDIQEQEQLLRVLNQQIELSKQQLELIELRYGQGIGDALQVIQQRLQVAQVQAEIPLVASTLATSRNQLAVVMGQPPQSANPDQPDSMLPDLPAFPQLPAPSDLLESRPDLRASHARLAAADYEVAAAIANQLPTVRISLDGGFSSPNVSSLFENTVGSIAGSLLQPVFDGNRREAEVDRRKAIVRERTISFSQDFLVALREIEDAIDREKFQADLLEQVINQLDLAQKNLEESKIRFGQGQTEYIDVIIAIQTLQRLERQEVTVRRGLLANRASLYVAIGGQWTRELEPDHQSMQASTPESGKPQS